MSIDKKDISYFANYKHPDHFGQMLGYRVTAFDPVAKEAKVGLTVKDDHLSPSGKLHGGVISSLLDYTCGVAVFTTLGKNDFASTVELKVNYFRPVLNGEEIEASAKVVFRGKKLCAVNAFLHRVGQEEPVAMASATFNVVENGGSTA
jgi:uncharacterized protein (TIGR00369 family)